MKVYYYFNVQKKDVQDDKYAVLEDILGKRRIKICNVSCSNDPFDFQVSFDHTTPKGFIRGFRNAFKRLKEKFGIVCFSEDVYNVLMWSHYAGKHRGLVLGLDFDDNMLTQVDYLPIAPRIMPRCDKCRTCSYRYNDLMRSVMRTKASDWAYEKEWRLILDYSESQNIQEEKSETGEVVARYYLLPPNSIQSLFVGLKCELDKPDAFSRLHKNGLDHVGLYKMEQSFDGYSLCASFEGTYENRQGRIKTYLKRVAGRIRK